MLVTLLCTIKLLRSQSSDPDLSLLLVCGFWSISEPIGISPWNYHWWRQYCFVLYSCNEYTICICSCMHSNIILRRDIENWQSFIMENSKTSVKFREAKWYQAVHLSLQQVKKHWNTTIPVGGWNRIRSIWIRSEIESFWSVTERSADKGTSIFSGTRFNRLEDWMWMAGAYNIKLVNALDTYRNL